MRMNAKLKDGTPVVVTHEDKGDVVPAFRDDGTTYPAYTSMIKVAGIDGKEVSYTFVQVDKELFKDGSNVVSIRLKEDMAAMNSMGVDTASLDG